jgi:hypothetical protein
MTRYCKCGCGTEVTIRKSDGKPAYWVRGHHGRGKFTASYKVNKTTGCWEWQGYITRHGYGSLSRDGETLAHRWYWKKVNGDVPEGKQLDHACKNTKCINPSHLRVYTNQENCQERTTTKVTPELVRLFRHLKKSGTNRKAIAKAFGLSIGHVSDIVAGRKWSNIKP